MEWPIEFINDRQISTDLAICLNRKNITWDAVFQALAGYVFGQLYYIL